MSAFDEPDEVLEGHVVVRQPGGVGDEEADAVVAAAPPVPEVDAAAEADDAGAQAEPIDLDEVDLRSAADGSLAPPAPLEGGDTPSLDVDRRDDDESLGHLAPVSTDAGDDAASLGHLATPAHTDPADDRASLDRTLDDDVDPHDDDESLGLLAPVATDSHADDASLGHLAIPAGADPAEVDETQVEDLFGDGEGERHDTGSEPFTQAAPATGERRAELDALVAQVAASQVPDDEVEPPFRWEDVDERSAAPRRDEAGPSTLRPKVPEPVLASWTTPSPSRSRRAASQLRALLGLLLVVVLAGVGLAGAIGAAVLLVVLVLSRAFGSGS